MEIHGWRVSDDTIWNIVLTCFEGDIWWIRVPQFEFWYTGHIWMRVYVCFQKGIPFVTNAPKVLLTATHNFDRKHQTALLWTMSRRMGYVGRQKYNLVIDHPWQHIIPSIALRWRNPSPTQSWLCTDSAINPGFRQSTPDSTPSKVCGPSVVTLLNWTPIFEWWMVRL